VLPEATQVDVFAAFQKSDVYMSSKVYQVWPELENHTVFVPDSFENVTGTFLFAEQFYKQWSKIEACLHLVELAEANFGFQYDFFARIRSDMYFRLPVNRWLTTNPTLVQTGAGLGCTPTDHFGVMPRHLAPIYASAHNVLKETPEFLYHSASKVMCHCPDMERRMWPECLIAGWLEINGVNVSNVCDHEYELWRHVHTDDKGNLYDLFQNVLKGPFEPEVEEAYSCSVPIFTPTVAMESYGPGGQTHQRKTAAKT
jgi:hypothetical protein